MNVYASLKQPDTPLMCPGYLVKEEETLLLSLGDTKDGCNNIMDGANDAGSATIKDEDVVAEVAPETLQPKKKRWPKKKEAKPQT